MPSDSDVSVKSPTKNVKKNRLSKYIPILDWLPNYQWKKHLSGDIVAGLTVGIMHVPQGMAYASLAGVPPVYGMYSSFFASSIYMLLGTSRHISIGVFAVASLMVGACRLRLVPDEIPNDNSTITYPLGREVSPLELTSALTFIVGAVQIILGLLRLGFVTTYLSDSLVSGFTTGSAAHVLVSQLNKVFGVKLPRHEGIGMLVLMVRDLILSLTATNYVALMISIAGILFLDLGRTYVNPFVKKFSPIPPPLELILVIAGVVISVIFGLKENYDIKIVNTIPRGLPSPSLPDVSIMPKLIGDAIPIAIVCYMFIVSMAKLFAKKHKYRVDPTQELYAAGVMSIGSSFFPVYPVGASLSRSSVCEMSGANTLLYTVFSSSILLTVIVFLGPFLEPLPMCILACIVIVSLKSLFLQAFELPRYWRVCKADFAIWLVSCLATTLTDVTKGLIISIAFAVLTIVLREQWPRFNVITNSSIPPQNVPDKVKILKFDAPLHFANVTKFIERLTNVFQHEENEKLLECSAVIVDCSAVAYIDTMGIEALKTIYKDAEKSGHVLYFAELNEDVLKAIDSDIGHGEALPDTALPKTVNEALLHFSKNPVCQTV
ncbi:unnamed protein product [Auanema sp. JU1783]|nr:unnamed protein product [Auanema sp. JU1783]